jgi:hypothetical protein
MDRLLRWEVNIPYIDIPPPMSLPRWEIRQMASALVRGICGRKRRDLTAGIMGLVRMEAGLLSQAMKAPRNKKSWRRPRDRKTAKGKEIILSLKEALDVEKAGLPVKSRFIVRIVEVPASPAKGAPMPAKD